MIELFEQNVRKIDRQSSKGNQLKWKEKDYWYKADYTGYEGLAEYVISHLLQKSDLKDTEFAIYEPEQIKYKATVYNGVKSKNFLKAGCQIVTLERLFKSFFGESLYTTMFRLPDYEQRLEFLVKQTERITGLKGVGVYINKLLTIDALFLNEDRHTHNIAVLMDERGEFDYCPIFDNGAALLADTSMDYPIGSDVYELIGHVKAKTICEDFDVQLDISEKLYKNNIRFCFTKKDVKDILESAVYYSVEERKRVEAVIFMQMDKYKYLFDKEDVGIF